MNHGGFRQRTHGMGHTRIYRVWTNMKTRVLDEKCERFKDYGGRGVKICARWLTFENFLADMGHPPRGKTIERNNNDGDYEPGNCHWATYREQTRNRKTNINITFQGETLCLKDWAARIGIGYVTLWGRYQRGWDTERMLTQRVKSG